MPHTADPQLPLTLARLHRATAPGGTAQFTLPPVPDAGPSLPDLVTGAGFALEHPSATAGGQTVTLRRLRTLPDTVGSSMRVLVCGLNPSLVAADAGYGFAGPTNRFWPVALDAGLVTLPRDPVRALLHDGVGMTDLVKRATPSAAALRPEEYADGAGRVGRLVAWLRPGLVLFVGLAGWRAAVDRHATAGWQPSGFPGLRGPNAVAGLRGPNAVAGLRGPNAVAGLRGPNAVVAPAYVMPSTSGLNAHASRAALADHVRAALALLPGSSA